MNIGIIKHMFNNAGEKDYLKFDYGSKSFTVKKSLVDYSLKGKGYYLKIKDKGKKEMYMLKTDSIDMITIIKPKFGYRNG